MAIVSTASADIDAPIEDVWAIVVDVAAWGDWQGKIGTVEALERSADGRVSRCRVAIDAGIQTFRIVLDVTHDDDVRRVAFTRQSGDLKSMRGSWELTDLGDAGTRATYALEVEPGGMLGLIVTGAVEQRLRGVLVDVRPDELRARVEAG